jgi:hypothetical protein
MTLNENIVKIINEEMSKSEIVSLINNKIDSNMSSKDFEKKIREISASIMSDLFKALWQRDSMWKSSIKK